MGDLTPSSAGSVPGLAIEAVEWLPSGAESGLIRVRGRWVESAAAQPELPALVLRAGGREHRFDSLPDARFGRDPSSWRGSYLVPAELVARDPEALWVEWAGGLKAGLPALARGLEPPPVDAPERPSLPQGGEAAGGQVIDRAVLAERRARRAEAAEQTQARVAAEAVKAVEVLELRSSELERRLEEATAERDALAARVGEGEQTERERRALAAALESAARLRAQLGDWRLRLRTSEVAHASDAVRLAVLQSRAAAADAGARAALHTRTQELEEERRRGEERAGELASARAEAAAAQEELTRARTAAAEELASARAAWEQRRAELERALDDVRAALARAREEADARVTEVEAAVREQQARGTELERRLAEEHEARASAERSAAAAEATAADLGARLTAAESAATEAGSRLAAAEAAATTAETRLRVETVARAALEDELDRERAARAALTAELDAAHAAVEPLRADLAAARAELAGARAELEGARVDLDAARREIEGLARSLEDERAARAAAEASAERTGATLQDRIAELERAAASAPSAERLERLAREQAEAAARSAGSPAPDLAARLDAAAAALREHGEEPRPTARPTPRPAVVRPAGVPVLRSALVRLAQDDPHAARRLLVALLPAQAAVIAGPLAYDLTIRGQGTYAISIVDGRVRAEAIGRPRSRRSAEFHLTADVLTLVELLSGVEHRIGRFFGAARIRGPKRRLAALEPLRRTPPTLADVIRAGARIEPDLAWRTLGYAIHPSWTRGLRFTVAQVLTGAEPRTWYLSARDGAGLAVTGTPPGGEPAATVTMSRSAFERLLREEPYEPGDRPAVRGDRDAVAQLLALAERARRGG